MYFLNIRAVKNRLQMGTPSSGEALPYLLAYFLLVQAAIAFPGTLESGWDRMVIAVEFVAAVSGTLALYQANGGSDGRDFIIRYFVLGWVVSLRILLLAVPLIALAAFALLLLGVDVESTGPFDVLYMLIFNIVFYLYFYGHMLDLRQRTPPPLLKREDI
jgi:hypothetical protein